MEEHEQVEIVSQTNPIRDEDGICALVALFLNFVHCRGKQGKTSRVLSASNSWQRGRITGRRTKYIINWGNFQTGL